MIEPISSEDELRFLERLVVENMVKNVFDEMEKDNLLHESLRVNGKISFENQAKFREVGMRTVGSAMEGLNVSDMAIPQPRNTRADQFCVLRSKDGMARPVVAVEYKPPTNLPSRRSAPDSRRRFARRGMSLIRTRTTSSSYARI
jgi:hypothetical protein